MAEKLGPRREIVEQKPTGHKQRRSWQRWTQHAEEEMAYNIDSLDILADFISKSGHRARDAGRLGDEAWENRFHSLKNHLIILAAQMRKKGANIQIGHESYTDSQLKRHERVIVVIGTKSKPLVTQTDFENLCTIMDPTAVRELIGSYDQLDPSIIKYRKRPKDKLHKHRAESWAKKAS